MTTVTITVVDNRQKVECCICKKSIPKEKHRLRIDFKAYSNSALRHICESCLTYFSNEVYLKNK